MVGVVHFTSQLLKYSLWLIVITFCWMRVAYSTFGFWTRRLPSSKPYTCAWEAAVGMDCSCFNMFDVEQLVRRAWLKWNAAAAGGNNDDEEILNKLESGQLLPWRWSRFCINHKAAAPLPACVLGKHTVLYENEHGREPRSVQLDVLHIQYKIRLGERTKQTLAEPCDQIINCKTWFMLRISLSKPSSETTHTSCCSCPATTLTYRTDPCCLRLPWRNCEFV